MPPKIGGRTNKQKRNEEIGVATPLFIRGSLLFVTFTFLAVIWEL